MAKLTTDQLDQLDGVDFLAKSGGGDVKLEASEEYGDAFSTSVDLLFGTPDVKIYAPNLISKSTHVALLIGFAIGNMWAATNRTKPMGFGGLIL